MRLVARPLEPDADPLGRRASGKQAALELLPQPRLRRERLLRRLAAPGDLGQQPLGLVALERAAVERASAALSSARGADVVPRQPEPCPSDWRSIR